MSKPLKDVSIEYRLRVRFDSESGEYTLHLSSGGMGAVEYSDASLHSLAVEIGADIKSHLISKAKQ